MVARTPRAIQRLEASVFDSAQLQTTEQHESCTLTRRYHDTDRVYQTTIRRERPPQVMDEDLEPWVLYILEGAGESEPLESSKELFTQTVPCEAKRRVMHTLTTR